MGVVVDIGQVLDGKYVIERLVGEGAWGHVYEGQNSRIRRRVAIKVLKAEYLQDEAMRERFEREARTATHIESAHVVQVYDAGVMPDGRPYIVMEFLTGEDLARRLRSTSEVVTPRVAVAICIQAAQGLADAHAAGILHRDVKPDNIFLVRNKHGHDVAKLLDFGISKLLDMPAMNLTMTGGVLGSPVYMSPEQARGSKDSDHRSDLFSLGVVLYECLTGRTPFVAETFNELLFKIALEDAPDVRIARPELDEHIARIVNKALSRDVVKRYQNADELRADLAEWLESHGGFPSEKWMTSSGPRMTYSPSNMPTGAPPLRVSAAPAAKMVPDAYASAPAVPPADASAPVMVGPADDVTHASKRSRAALIAAVAAAALLTAGGAVWRSRSPAPVPVAANPAPVRPADEVPTKTEPTMATPVIEAPAAAPTAEPKRAAVESAGRRPPVRGATKKQNGAEPTEAPKAAAAPSAAPQNEALVGGRTIRTEF